MKNFLKLTGILLIVSCQLVYSGSSGKKNKLKSKTDSVSFLLGVSVSDNLKNFPGIDLLNLDLICSGIQKGMSEEGSDISKEELEKVIKNYFEEYLEKESEAALKEGQEFLAKNKKKENIIVTESGLQYRIIREGTGEMPLETDSVKVHYEGRLLNGKIFDSSHEKGEPIEIELSRVIKGWTEGIQLMMVGAVYEFFIPADLAYGNRSVGEIMPNSTLIFEIELVEILK